MKIRIEHIKPIVSEQQKKHERIKGLDSSVFAEIFRQKNGFVVETHLSFQ